MADRTEYADEQDYSLNAGRYVGVEIENENISAEEFKTRLKEHISVFDKLSNTSQVLEQDILKSVNQFLL
jgi:type I restriction enzyme M protein